MSSKAEKKRAKRYLPAPPKSSSSYFFTSFILTLALCLSAVGFIVVDKNSQKMGWGHDLQVFSVISGSDKVGFTFMDNDFFVDAERFYDVKNTFDEVFSKAKTCYNSIEPEPVYFSRVIYRWCYQEVAQLLEAYGP